jgi:pseudouridine kinase
LSNVIRKRLSRFDQIIEHTSTQENGNPGSVCSARLALPCPLRQNSGMSQPADILCIGSVLWDVIGRSPSVMRAGSDMPGRIARIPGGVAMNIAMTLARFGLRPALLSAVGRDAEGEELVAECARLGCLTEYLYRSEDLPTDVYMAVEGANGLIAAIADAHSLEAAGARILRPLTGGRLGSAEVPYPGVIALDGNLTESLLADIAEDPAFEAADLRIAPASPGKAERLLPLLRAGRGTLYVNLEEAGLLCQTRFDTAPEAGKALLERGAARAVVTDGGRTCCDAGNRGLHIGTPPEVLVTRITGAGDTFMAAHIAAEIGGDDRDAALIRALQAAASYVSGEIAQ